MGVNGSQCAGSMVGARSGGRRDRTRNGRRTLRIALFTDTYPPQVNGVSRTLARLARHGVEAGHSLLVVAPQAVGNGIGRVHAPDLATVRDPVAGSDTWVGGPTIALPSLHVPFYPELRLGLPLSLGLSERLRSFAPELVHVATEFTVGWLGVRWALDRGVPLVSSFHTDFAAYLAAYGLSGLESPAWSYLRGFHARARLTFCPSRNTRDRLLEHGFDPRLRVWSRGVDATLFSPARRTPLTRSRLAGGAAQVLLYVGRLAPEKNLELLLEAYALLRGRCARPVALVIVGDGPARPALERRAPEGTTFTGYLEGEALAEAYAAADLFVFPSHTETFGNVVLEALASGLPVVAPARGGVTDIVRPGRTGELVRAGDAEAFAVAVLELLADEGQRLRMAAAARQEALGRRWPAVFEGLFADYREAIASHEAIAA